MDTQKTKTKLTEKQKTKTYRVVYRVAAQLKIAMTEY